MLDCVQVCSVHNTVTGYASPKYPEIDSEIGAWFSATGIVIISFYTRKCLIQDLRSSSSASSELIIQGIHWSQYWHGRDEILFDTYIKTVPAHCLRLDLNNDAGAGGCKLEESFSRGCFTELGR